jgi:hypothetical protein
MNNSKPPVITPRCSHRTPSGRRCRQLSVDSKSGLCPYHLDIRKQITDADVTKSLVSDWSDFQTAQGINFSLGSLYKLLAANLISARRASVLAFISSLMLRTHSAIDADQDAGIIIPADSTSSNLEKAPVKEQDGRSALLPETTAKPQFTPGSAAANYVHDRN